LSQGETYGWWRPIADFSIAKTVVWPDTAPISIVPCAFVVGALLIYVFVRTELTLERNQRHPLFEFSQFRFLTFRYANIATFSMAFAQLGASLSIALYLQESEHLTPLENGLWVLPVGLAILVGAPFGGWISRYLGATNTLRVGAVLNAIALLAEAMLLTSDAPYWGVFPGFFAYGFTAGIVSSQMNQVMLYDIAPEKTGAASGINTTARQIATALGVATMGTIFATVAKNHDVHDALLPSLLVGFFAFVVTAAVMFRLPQIRIERRSTEEELIDHFALVDPIDARMET
jgi:predicted MFS family arabinose efflux permease